MIIVLMTRLNLIAAIILMPDYIKVYVFIHFMKSISMQVHDEY